MDLAKQVIVYRMTHKIKIPDAIILATEKNLGADLVTVNDLDFKGVDKAVSIVKPILN